MTHRITLLLEYTKLLETMPKAEPEETEAAETVTEEMDAKSEAAETDAGETAAVITEEKPASKTTAKAASKSTAKSTSKGTLKNASVKNPLSDSAKKKAAAEAEKPKDPDEAILKGVSDLLPRKGMEWFGIATELLEKLGRPDISPNIATRKLNENAAKLLSDYGISYERIRNHDGRLIKLTRVAAKNRRKSAKKKEGES